MNAQTAATGQRHPRGGLYFEDFSIGQTFKHGLTRTVTQMDNMLFSNMTLNPQPLHIDAHFCETETQWGKPLMNSLFTLGLMIGISVNDTTIGTTIGNLGMTDVKFPAPLFEGDTIRVETEIVAIRTSKSRNDAGIVDFQHRAFKQDGTLVAECRRQGFMLKAARLMRSQLFVPGDSQRKMEKGLASGADCLFIDLEDSVATARKDEARAMARAFLEESHKLAKRPLLFVRVNALDTGLIDRDLDAIMPAKPDGILLPKSQGGADVQHLSAKLAVREAENDLPDTHTKIACVATETASAIFGLSTYAGASRRLCALTWGAEDLSAELGTETSRLPDGTPTPPYALARTLTLIAAVSAGVQPIDTVYPNFRDGAGFLAECETARRDGFTGKMAIHPDQVAVINSVFTPPKEQIERARKVVQIFADNPDSGVIGLDGEMLDRPHLLRAQRLLARIDGI